uniref:Uncharacterized protein n=1 Tax=Trypanosoma congolense (strain IL3000) TaxID=1068625 RepID=G0UT04_TRYCI|nr:hypothetical protein, unlikely [Trypanosoma congolense IL3000]
MHNAAKVTKIAINDPIISSVGRQKGSWSGSTLHLPPRTVHPAHRIKPDQIRRSGGEQNEANVAWRVGCLLPFHLPQRKLSCGSLAAAQCQIIRAVNPHAARAIVRDIGRGTGCPTRRTGAATPGLHYKELEQVWQCTSSPAFHKL